MPKSSDSEKSKESKSKKYYCGIGEVPRGKIRAPVEYCIQHNQVRYYGLVAIDPKLLVSAKGKTTDLNKEKIKLHKINADIKILLKDFSMIKIILSDPDAKPSKIKKAEAKKAAMLKRRDVLRKKFIEQNDVIKNLEKEEARAKKAKKEAKAKKAKKEAKTKKVTKKKAIDTKYKTKSGSKTLKSKSKSEPKSEPKSKSKSKSKSKTKSKK